MILNVYITYVVLCTCDSFAIHCITMFYFGDGDGMLLHCCIAVTLRWLVDGCLTPLRIHCTTIATLLHCCGTVHCYHCSLNRWIVDGWVRWWLYALFWKTILWTMFSIILGSTDIPLPVLRYDIIISSACTVLEFCYHTASLPTYRILTCHPCLCALSLDRRSAISCHS